MNIIKIKSFELSLEIINLSKLLKSKREFTFANQILRSGTSIGANITEAFAAQSRKDFIAKLGIAYKEMRETEYWIRLLKESSIIPLSAFHQIDIPLTETAKLLTATLKTAKANNSKL